MARFRILVGKKGLRYETVKKVAEKVFAGYSVQVTKENEPVTRAERFDRAKDLASQAREEIENLRDELEAWKDSLPENLQNGQKADELDEAINALQEAADGIETMENTDVEFPSMMG